MCAAQLLTRRSTVLTTHACHIVPQLTGELVWELPTETAVDPFAGMEAMLDDDEPADESAEAKDVDPDDPFAAMEAMLAGGASSSDDEDLATTEDAEDDDDFRMLEAMLDM